VVGAVLQELSVSFATRQHPRRGLQYYWVRPRWWVHRPSAIDLERSSGALVGEAVRRIALAKDGGWFFTSRAWDNVELKAADFGWPVNASYLLRCYIYNVYRLY
jgi:hypothetical protein